MTKEELKQTAAAMLAYADDKPVQSFDTSWYGATWGDEPNPVFNCPRFIYRPKPEPVTRPWSKPEDVPGPVCWVRRSGADDRLQLVTFISGRGVWFGVSMFAWEALEGFEHSTDRINWAPCVVQA